MKQTRTTALLLTPILFGLVAASNSAGQAPSAIPDEALYRAVFLRVLSYEKAADYVEGKGRSGASMRSNFRREAQLTEAEESALKAVVRAHEAAFQVYEKKLAQLHATARAQQYKPDAATKAELQRTVLDYDAMTLDKIAELKAKFGPARFQVFNNYVRSVIAPHVKYTVIEPPK